MVSIILPIVKIFVSKTVIAIVSGKGTDRNGYSKCIGIIAGGVDLGTEFLGHQIWP
jgi:hypothetical protein